VRIAGVELDDRAVLELARLLRRHGFESTALGLERAFDAVAPDYGLRIPQREQVLRALDERPAGPLAQLRGLLLEEHSAGSATGSSEPSSGCCVVE